MRVVRTFLPLVIAFLLYTPVVAQEQAGIAEESVVTYPADFFARYQPNTALEMVSQVPGFQLDDGADERGFGGSVGNVLINDRYPSAKQNKPSQILERIPAAQVERIELIRGQVREIDLLGRPAVVNVILAADTPAAIRWELALRKNLALTPLAPIGSISISDQWRGMNYNFGVDGRRASFADPGTRELFDGDGTLTEIRYEDHEGTGFNANSQFTATGDVGATLLRLNAAFGAEVRNEELITLNDPVPAGSASTSDRLVRKRDNIKFEIGADAERNLGEDLIGKAILLYFQLDQGPSTTQRRFDTEGEQTLYRQAETDAKSTESIARLEFSWSKFQNHVLQLNVEGAKNVLDSSLVQIVDTGTGPEIVPVPGANTRVEEVRGDILINDTWSFGDFKFEYGLGAETSTISQTGDAEQKRSFSFIKPRTALTYSASSARQTRLRLAREVSQLDFNDFVSATVFEDDDVALGNPNLQPESTWIAELSEEWRFGELGVVKVTAFHDWISDVEDLLPLTPEFEVPGNIGDGRRWGVELESTVPLQFVGLVGAKLDAKLRWQESTVTDPVTGQSRVLTADGGNSQDIKFYNENRYTVILDFRQDLEKSRVAWGWHYATRAERPLFKVNELEVYDEGTQLNAFIETTRWWGLKIRFTANNILDVVDTRDRTIYTGERELSPVDYRELRTMTNGTRLILSFSGAF